MTIRQKVQYLTGSAVCRPIFVIGTGRSGTHWLGQSLGNHPEIRLTVEAPPMFGWSTTMALRPETESRLLQRLLRMYRWQLFRSAPRHYLDKNHPNLWIADKLKSAFPHALFIGIERNPYATVASMMKHQGVASWHKRWREFPVPNRFLGISSDIAGRYDAIPLASQCAMRWRAHHIRMKELRSVLADSLKLISYESFAQRTEETIHELQQFLGLAQPIPEPEVKTESLQKWRSQLSSDEIRQIQDVVGFSPESLHQER
jgi:hypothetical protein